MCSTHSVSVYCGGCGVGGAGGGANESASAVATERRVAVRRAAAQVSVGWPASAPSAGWTGSVSGGRPGRAASADRSGPAGRRCRRGPTNRHLGGGPADGDPPLGRHRAGRLVGAAAGTADTAAAAVHADRVGGAHLRQHLHPPAGPDPALVCVLVGARGGDRAAGSPVANVGGGG